VWLEYHDKWVKNCGEGINDVLPGLRRGFLLGRAIRVSSGVKMRETSGLEIAWMCRGSREWWVAPSTKPAAVRRLRAGGRGDPRGKACGTVGQRKVQLQGLPYKM
jgi:hypothetical protein